MRALRKRRNLDTSNFKKKRSQNYRYTAEKLGEACLEGNIGFDRYCEDNNANAVACDVDHHVPNSCTETEHYYAEAGELHSFVLQPEIEMAMSLNGSA